MSPENKKHPEGISIKTILASITVIVSAFVGLANIGLMIEYAGCKGSACGAGMGILFLSVFSFLSLTIPLVLSLGYLRSRNYHLYLIGSISIWAIIAPLVIFLFGPILHNTFEYMVRFINSHI